MQNIGEDMVGWGGTLGGSLIWNSFSGGQFGNIYYNLLVMLVISGRVWK